MIPNEFTEPVHTWLGLYAFGYLDFQYMVGLKYGVEFDIVFNSREMLFKLYPTWW